VRKMRNVDWLDTPADVANATTGERQ